jgi:hypothetical protein
MNLATQQQAMLQAVFGSWDEAALRGTAAQNDALRVRGLQAYRSNGHALAQRALNAAFPVTAQMLHEENFYALSRAFWHACPPVKGDIAQWGADLADFMAKAPQLIDEPHVPYVARVEWALHVAATAADKHRNPASFALLMEHDPSRLELVTAAGLCVVNSPWPVVSIVNAHVAPELQLEHAAQRLRAGIGEAAVIWRQGFKPVLRDAVPGEPAMLSALLAGQSLAQALDAALLSNSEFDFNAWLVLAVRDGLVVGAALFQPEEKNDQ